MKRLWKRLGCLRGRHTWVIREVQWIETDLSGILNGSLIAHGTCKGPVCCEWCGKERQ